MSLRMDRCFKKRSLIDCTGPVRKGPPMRTFLIALCSAAALSAPAFASIHENVNALGGTVSFSSIEGENEVWLSQTAVPQPKRGTSTDSAATIIADGGFDTVGVFDFDAIAAGNSPEAGDVSPDGKAMWVGNDQSPDIFVFDTQSMEKINRIDAGFMPNHVRFHPDGQFVAVADPGGDRVVVYDAESHSIVSEIDLAAAGMKTPASLLFAPDGSSLFVGARPNGNVAEIDVGTWTLHRVLDAGTDIDGPTYASLTVTRS
ncbi:YncE family protein [Hoeflea sp. TYP-13]|uniref:YncE family protein n=1 Tax=Hoeflea sp. TYP-13 TaxID=3230023 RepID=UPI0034C60129